MPCATAIMAVFIPIAEYRLGNGTTGPDNRQIGCRVGPDQNRIKRGAILL